MPTRSPATARPSNPITAIVIVPQMTVISRWYGTGSPIQLTGAIRTDVNGPCSAVGRSLNTSRKNRPSVSCFAHAE